MRKFYTLFCVACMTATVYSQNLWTEVAADSFAGGDGTYDNPYEIATPEQLAKIAKDCDEGNSFFDDDAFDCKYFKLVSDIDLKGRTWEPIGGYRNNGGKAVFEGYFDGNGYVIKNLDVNKSGAPFQGGLFNTIGDFGELHNVIIESGSVVGEAGVAAIAAMSSGKLYRCENYASVLAEAKMMAGSGVAGGVCGTVKPTQSGEPASIIGCINYGEIKAGTFNGFKSAGIVSVIEGNCEIRQCANFGNIIALTGMAGGIISYSASGCIIKDCYNRGKISSSEQMAGILGSAKNDDANIIINNCYNAAQITDRDGFSVPASLAYNSIFGHGIGTKYVIADSLYNDRDINISGFMDDIIHYDSCKPGKEIKEMDTESMSGNEDFVKCLNKSSKGTWVMDTENINDGYPVFRYQNPNAPSSIKESGFDSRYIIVYHKNNRIFVKGNVETISVIDLSGNILYAGNPDSLSEKPFEAGLYIIKTDDRSFKICIE